MKFITVTDNRFFIGTAVLLYSMVKNAAVDFEFVVLHDGLSQAKVEYFKSIWSKSKIIDIGTMKKIKLPENKLGVDKIGRLKKLSIFTMDIGEKFCYLDSDMLCLGDMSDVDTFDHFSAAPDLGRRAYANVGGRPMFNSGFIVFRSSEDFLEELLDFARSDHFDQKADQWLLNDFMYHRHPGEVSIIHSVFNAPVSLSGSNPSFFNDLRAQGIRIVHFTNTKPWEKKSGIDALRSAVKERHARWNARKEFAEWHHLANEMIGTFGTPA